MCDQGSSRRKAPRSVAYAFGTLVFALFQTACVHLDLGVLGGGAVEERLLQGESGPKIVLLEIDGVLSEDDERSSLGFETRPAIPARVHDVLERARKDPDVRAVVVRVNSPGGTITASDVVYDEIRRYKADTSMPVIVQMMGIAASGGYYVSMAGDRVFASPTTVTGSIGVIFLGLNLTGLLEKVGIADQTLTAGSRKDSGSWLRPMRPEERAQLQGVLDEMHARFKQVVVQGRPQLDAARVAALADGRVYTAEQAKANGLVDEIGYLPDTIAYAASQAGLVPGRYRVVTYAKKREGKENIYSEAPGGSEPRASMRESIRLAWPRGLEPQIAGPGFLYLWIGGE